VLEASSLTIARGRRTVLAGVDVSLPAGQAFHLTGANGSGKTSLLRVLAGLAAPRGGRIVRRGTCAFVPEKVALASAMKPSEWLATMRRLRGAAALDWPAAAAASGLDPDVLEYSSASFSKGMLQRIALLEALHAGADVLLLDEPFVGLDPGGREWAVRTIARSGAAVLLTDHSGTRLEVAAELRIAGGALAVAASEARVTVTASRAGERVEHAVAAADSDELLRELLAAGWHVERLR
jgi:ABC-type multidrug transport system ATPase subunit